jgi:hypothetical protein
MPSLCLSVVLLKHDPWNSMSGLILITTIQHRANTGAR